VTLAKRIERLERKHRWDRGEFCGLVITGNIASEERYERELARREKLREELALRGIGPEELPPLRVLFLPSNGREVG
jgi:hypothetical protein